MSKIKHPYQTTQSGVGIPERTVARFFLFSLWTLHYI